MAGRLATSRLSSKPTAVRRRAPAWDLGAATNDRSCRCPPLDPLRLDPHARAEAEQPFGHALGGDHPVTQCGAQHARVVHQRMTVNRYDESAFAAQKVARLEESTHDVRLHGVVTEGGVYGRIAGR